MDQRDPLSIAAPAEMGYEFIPEWAPHAATWLAWPHRHEDWPERFGPIPWVYVDFVKQLHHRERVRILMKDADLQRKATDLLDRAGVDLGQVDFVSAATDRSWTRDSIPSFIGHPRATTETDRLALVGWKFNGWAKYDEHEKDRRVSREVARFTGRRRFLPRARTGEGPWRWFVLEGGAIDGNGCGTLLATEECLLSSTQARNPGLGREEVEAVLRDFLAARHVIWLGRGIAGDDTHGHVDDISRFVNPHTVVTVVERDPNDVNYEPLQDNLARLQDAHDQDGRKLDVVTLPMPRPVTFEGQRLPASYANFFIANGAVFVPTFNDPADRHALSTLEAIFPDREVIGIHALDLVWGLGTLHCMTHEEPAPPERRPI